MVNSDPRTRTLVRWSKRGAILAAVAIAAVVVFRDAIFGTPVAPHAARRAEIVQTIVATGRVMTPLRVSVGAVITERVGRIPVDEGQAVKAGDVLIALEDRDERSALAQAQATLASAEAKLAQTVIRAPVDGVLIAREVEAGDVVQPGRELMVLAPAGETQIDVRIDEKNLAQLAIGQRALASADAFPADRFTAVLFYINPGVDSLCGSVDMKLRVPDPPAYLRQDMTVSVDVEVVAGVSDGERLVPASSGVTSGQRIRVVAASAAAS